MTPQVFIKDTLVLSHLFGSSSANGSPFIVRKDFRLDPFSVFLFLELVLKVFWVRLPVSPVFVPDELDGCQEPNIALNTLVLQLKPMNRPKQ